MSKITAAERARLAHRALRLRENGVESQKQLKQLRANAAGAGGQVTQQSVDLSLGNIALSVLDHMDDDAPGPTDEKTVVKLMEMDIDSIYKEWVAAVEQNIEETATKKELEAWRKAQRDDQKRYEEIVAQAQEHGDFPVHPYFGHNRHEAGAANAVFDLGRQGFLDGDIDWSTAVIKMVLVDSADYAVNLATHQFMSSVEAVGTAVEERSGAFTNKSSALGVADADDVTFTAATGDPCEALIIYQASAVTGGADISNTSQRLIAYIDTATGLPVTLNGGNVTVTWDNGSNRIFKL